MAERTPPMRSICVWEHNRRALDFHPKEGLIDVDGTNFHVGPDRQTDRVLVATVGPGMRDASPR